MYGQLETDNDKTFTIGSNRGTKSIYIKINIY